MKTLERLISCAAGRARVYRAALVSLAVGLIVPGAYAHTADDPFVRDLIAGGGNPASAIDVGDVLVWNDGEQLFVRYHVTAQDWCLTETNSHVATSADAIPHTKKGNPIPGKFDFSATLDCVTSLTFAVPLTWGPGVELFIATHASLENPSVFYNNGPWTETAWGAGFDFPGGNWATYFTYAVQAPTDITVINLNDSGDGSLRQALADVATGGTITFDPALAGGTLQLTTGPLVPVSSATIDASAAPGISLNGGGIDRLLIVEAGLTVNVVQLTLTNGYGFQLAGGILNNGDLTLDHVTVTNNVMTTGAGDFWQGGGGIYNGAGATLYLVDSTVSGNTGAWSGGGVYSFFNTTTVIERSTISGNVSNDVGGGIHMLGNATIVNSTLSGNTATGWYGGAIFHTDGVMDIVSSTVADNLAPDYAGAAIFVGTFTNASATINLTNSVVADNTFFGCFLGYFGAGAVALNSGGYNVDSDGSCNLTAPGDQPNTDPLLTALADNGGPTLTHALSAGSPAIDAADAGNCPATDQRGVTRPQGAGCDVGAFELE